MTGSQKFNTNNAPVFKIASSNRFVTLNTLFGLFQDQNKRGKFLILFLLNLILSRTSAPLLNSNRGILVNL